MKLRRLLDLFLFNAFCGKELCITDETFEQVTLAICSKTLADIEDFFFVWVCFGGFTEGEKMRLFEGLFFKIAESLIFVSNLEKLL
ncbi:hypothetical protein RF55_15956 [Lasius niger]|uniref:Uncharacterized protein n=1 Tax=Lasius niger TaxID=67767 RepID=A0A0J7K5K0_LASNI|nr:hypothetical protein RF55_15956 [Lasius niger]